MNEQVIWKYELHPGVNALELPIGAQVLSVAAQRDNLCLWALVNPTSDKELRCFEAVATGSGPTDEHSRFIGTVLLFGDSIVTHVFEANIS